MDYRGKREVLTYTVESEVFKARRGGNEKRSFSFAEKSTKLGAARIELTSPAVSRHLFAFLW